MIREFQIPQFLEYLNIAGNKSDMIHITRYGNHQKLRLASDPILIDFYFLALKLEFDTDDDFGKTELDEESSSLAYFDQPKTLTNWNVKKAWKGYHILIGRNLQILMNMNFGS